jgi:hypothetical protein
MKNLKVFFLKKFIIFAIFVVWLLLVGNIVNAASRTIGTTTWNNTNFISQTFWDANPSDTDIIKALY